VVQESLQKIGGLWLLRVRKLILRVALDAGHTVVEQKLEAGPAGNGRLVLVSVRAWYVYGGLQAEKRTHLVDDRLGVIDEALEKDGLNMVPGKNVEIARQLRLIEAAEKERAGAVLKLVLKPVDGASRLHAVPVV